MAICRNCGRRIVDNELYMHDGPYWIHGKCPVQPGLGALCGRCGDRIRDGEEATAEGYHLRCPSITNLGKFN